MNDINLSLSLSFLRLQNIYICIWMTSRAQSEGHCSPFLIYSYMIRKKFLNWKEVGVKVDDGNNDDLETDK